VQTDSPHLRPRRVDGTWLDLERSLGEQGCTSGGIVCLEPPDVQHPAGRHDPVAEIVERGPPVELVPDAAVVATTGALVAAMLVAAVPWAAPVLLAVAPCAWALLPALGGLLGARDGRGVRRVLGAVALAVGSGALVASGDVARDGSVGLVLGGCVALAVLAHVARRRAAGALVRVFLGAAEWLALLVVLPLTSFAAGWSHL
jgi:hypothetical protein